MGNFYVNFTTRGSDQATVGKCLRAAKRKAYVSPTVDDVTVFYDQDADKQDESVTIALGKFVSKSLKSPVMATLNHDDDVLCYWLFEAGKVADKYNSCPGCFTGDDEPPSGGNPKKLCAAFGVSTKAKAVDKILHDEEYVFAFERHEALATLLKHPWSYACLGYDYISDRSLAIGIRKKEFLRIG